MFMDLIRATTLEYLSVPDGFHIAQLDQCLNYIVASTSLKTFNCYKRKAQVLFVP